MQPFVSLLYFLPPTFNDAPGMLARTVVPLSARPSLLLTVSTELSLHRIEDAFIGLSCVAIASTLASFLSTSDRSIPFRRLLIVLTVCTAVAGLGSLVSAAMGREGHLQLGAEVTLFGAVLAIFTACLLPFLLPLLLSKARELQVTSLAARQSETRFLAATQSSSDAFMLLDTLRAPDGTIEDFSFTYLNANAEKLLQLPGSRVLGSRLTRTLPIEPTDRLFQQFCQVIQTGRPLLHEFPLDANDPASPWMRHHVARLGEGLEAGLAITASDISERKLAEGNLPPVVVDPDAQHDPLTGLPNRRLLDDRIQQAIIRADRYRNRVAVIHVDIDGFRRVNAAHGRELGDLALCTLATRLRSAIRATDSVLRVEGDEFIVIMPDMRLEVDVRRAAAALVAILWEPVVLDGRAIRLTCSLGVTTYPDTARSVSELLIAAAAALNQARQLGRNQYVLHTTLAETGLYVDADSDMHSDTDSRRQYVD